MIVLLSVARIFYYLRVSRKVMGEIKFSSKGRGRTITLKKTLGAVRDQTKRKKKKEHSDSDFVHSVP